MQRPCPVDIDPQVEFKPARYADVGTAHSPQRERMGDRDCSRFGHLGGLRHDRVEGRLGWCGRLAQGCTFGWLSGSIFDDHRVSGIKDSQENLSKVWWRC